MRLTTKGRFAVTAMIDIALHGRHGPVTLASISLRQQVSLSYLEMLFAKLRRSELVESTRGPGGGYSLHRKASEISVAAIVLAIEDTDPKARTRRDATAGTDSGDSGRCEVEELWASVNNRAVEFLRTITLQSLVDDQKVRNAQADAVAVRERKPVTPVRKPFVVNAPNSVFALGTRALG